MLVTIERLHQRNQEIGFLLIQARKFQERSVTDCATRLATSRRRYSAIERGEAAISAAELELLIEYLEIPAQKLGRAELLQSDVQHIVVQASPGKLVQVIVEVQG